MAQKLIKGAGFIEKAGTNYAGSTQDEANIGEVLAGRAHWEDDTPEAPLAGLASAAPIVGGSTGGGPNSGLGGGGNIPSEGTMGMGMPGEPAPIHMASTPGAGRQGIGGRIPPSLESALAGLRRAY